jgi:Mg2+ and Co2+ transporter CorA
MTTPRRRVLRPAVLHQNDAVDRRQARLVARRQGQLTKDRLLLKRWMSRLRRAFHQVEQLQDRVSRLERQLIAEA